MQLVNRDETIKQQKENRMYRFTQHCKERMKSRKINLSEFIQVVSRGVQRPIAEDHRFQYDYSDLRLIITENNLLITIYRLEKQTLFPKKDNKTAGKLYRRKIACLREREALKEMQTAV